MRRRQHAFTLIEILVALFIFALVALISGQLLSRTLSAQDQLQDRGERLALVHRAMQIVQRDLLQLTDRSIRDSDSLVPLAPLLINTDGFVEMTRRGWRNPPPHSLVWRTPKGSNSPRRRGRGNFTAEHVIARGKMIKNLRALDG